MRSDFGLELRRPPAAWLADLPYFFLGIGLQLAALLPIGLLNELYGHTAKQDVVNTADQASGWQIPVLALAIVLLAPLTEELLFRGTLLRSLLRKVTPETAVFVSAVVFGLVHALGDPVGGHASSPCPRSSSWACAPATRPSAPATCRARSSCTWASTPSAWCSSSPSDRLRPISPHSGAGAQVSGGSCRCTCGLRTGRFRCIVQGVRRRE